MNSSIWKYTLNIALVILAMLVFTVMLAMIAISYLVDSDRPNPLVEYVVQDVAKPQEFIIPARLINPVVLRAKVEGVVDDSVSVHFKTAIGYYLAFSGKGVISDSAVCDFYETKDIHIIYEPHGAKKGQLVIRATLNW